MTLENVCEVIAILGCAIASGIAGYLVCYIRWKEKELKDLENKEIEETDDED